MPRRWPRSLPMLEMVSIASELQPPSDSDSDFENIFKGIAKPLNI